ncbi:MAG: matrixin family metalloprotease [Nitrososphaerota archaeon]
MGRRILGAVLLFFLFLPYLIHPPLTPHSHNITHINETLEIAENSSRSIDMIGAWRKSVLTVLIAPTSDERYTRWAGQAVDWWARAIETFTALYNYSYLSQLRFVKLVEGVNGTSGDIVIRYVQTLGERICGAAYPYIVNGEIRRVAIELSKECIAGREEYAIVVALHEFGHALGLGHTENSKDLMYEYLVPGSRPSTLNLYALAVAYSWLDAGYFKRPPEQVSLIEEIDYLQLLDVDGLPVKLRVRIYLDLNGEEQLYKTIIVTAGERISINVDTLISGVNNDSARFLFAGWRLRGSQTLISQNVTLSIKPTLNADYVASFYAEYRVVIDYGQGLFTDEWVRRGHRISVAAPYLVNLTSSERLVFKMWKGSVNSTSNAIELIVEGPVRLSAVYEREFLVEVSSEIGVAVGAGWWPEGTILNITVSPSIVEINEQNRLFLKGFEGTFYTPSQLVSLNISSPVRLTAIWIVQHLVRVESPGREVSESFWVDHNSQTVIMARPGIVWSNGTQAVFAGWLSPIKSTEPYLVVNITAPSKFVPEYRRYYYVDVKSTYPVNVSPGWYQEGEILELSIPKSIELDAGRRAVFLGATGGATIVDGLRLKVEAPCGIILHWREEVLVVVEGGVWGGEEALWVPVNQTIMLHAPRIIAISEDESLEFVKWSGRVESNASMLSLKVEESIRLTPLYRRLYRVSVTTNPPIEASILLRGENGAMIRFSTEERAWLPEGSFEVLEIDWHGRDVKETVSLNVTSPGRYMVNVSVARPAVKVADFLGLPAPFFQISVQRPDGTVEWDGYSDGYGNVALHVAKGDAVRLKAGWMVFEQEDTFNPLEPVVRVPIGLYSLLLYTALAFVACFLVAWKKFSASAS